MKTHILCLANSKKYNERCVAGIELKKIAPDSYDIVKFKGKHNWMRPVSHCEFGEMPENVVGKIKLKDIFEIDVVSKCPQGFQSENVFVNEKSIKIIREAKFVKKNVEKLIDKEIEFIYGDVNKSVNWLEIKKFNNSLMFIKPEEPKFIKVSNRFVKDQLRT